MILQHSSHPGEFGMHLAHALGFFPLLAIHCSDVDLSVGIVARASGHTFFLHAPFRIHYHPFPPVLTCCCASEKTFLAHMLNVLEATMFLQTICLPSVWDCAFRFTFVF